MTELQTFLRDGGTFEELKTRYGISANPSAIWPHLFLFKYSQIESPMQERIVQESRGIILDSENDWRCVARGFDKFFNYGEPNAVAIDWDTARVQEKVDGSLCLLYHYKGQWQVATSGSAAASGPVGNESITFANLFWQTYQNEYGGGDFGFFTEIQDSLPCYLTYIFELTAPQNRIIVNHQTARLTLLSIRQSRHGTWVDYPTMQHLSKVLKVPLVREYALQNLAEVLKSLEHINPMEQEGYVVVDDRNHRIKVKHPQYVALHHMKSQTSNRAFAEVVRQGETAEITAHFPELAAQFAEVQGRFDALCEEIRRDYETIFEIETQKDFALQATKMRLPAALFQLRAGRVQTPREFLAAIPIDSLLKHLGYKDVAAQSELAAA